MRTCACILIAVFWLVPGHLESLAQAAAPAGGEFQASVASKVITPPGSIWMAGYAARTRPSDEVLQDLHAKVLALRDERGERLIIVTADLIALPRDLCNQVAERAGKKHGLERRQILFNASHTHAGPVVWRNLDFLLEGGPAEREKVVRYRERLADDLTGLIDKAMADLAPATLAVGHGRVGFAVNRRQPTEKGFRIGVNPTGPVDHDVPVLRIASPDGKVRAVLFGYACHNTTQGGNNYRINGDYAGFAQTELEKLVPGATAVFMILCGGNQNPGPRGTTEIAEQYGKALAGEVKRVLDGELKAIRPAIRSAFGEVDLEFTQPTRAWLEEEAKSTNRFRKRRAESVLAAMDAGKPMRHLAVPVQAAALGEGLAIAAMGGEVVVEYALRLKRAFPRTDLVVAGYSNDVPAYIPSRRMLGEGGYEPIESMIYYGHPGPFTDTVEETMIAACRRALAAVGCQATGPDEPIVPAPAPAKGDAP